MLRFNHQQMFVQNDNSYLGIEIFTNFFNGINTEKYKVDYT